MLEVHIYYPLNSDEYTPFKKDLEDYLFSLDGNYASGTSLVDKPKIRDHALDIEEAEWPIISDKLKELLPEGGWLDIFIDGDRSKTYKPIRPAQP